LHAAASTHKSAHHMKAGHAAKKSRAHSHGVKNY
jgi:hypothetical protein